MGLTGEEEAVNELSVALWATNVGPRLNGLDAWISRIDAKMTEAKAKGADLLVIPEYASVQWLSFAPEGIALDREIAWMASQAPDALGALRPLVARHDMALLAGSMPVGADGAYVNRAHLFLPDGQEHIQDKLCLTPQEQNPQGWNLQVGGTLNVISWRGLRLAIAICLDIELPALAARLAPLALDVILVPSMTEALSGYHRVFDCAKARAVETQSILCPVGTIGDTGYRDPVESNVSGAAVYGPCEESLGSTGVLGSLPPQGHDEGDGPMLVVKDLPIAEVRAMRKGGAYVWPGAWSGEHVIVNDPQGQ
ncbi:MAG: nitrilase-related carbon-nitrogen hydrolase [Alphaproteobacteria bacterium]